MRVSCRCAASKRSTSSPRRSRTVSAPPDEVSCLIELARLAERCRALAVVKIDAGPQAIALTFRHDAVTSSLEHVDERLCWRGERLAFAQPTEHAGQRLLETSLLLRRQLSRRRRR